MAEDAPLPEEGTGTSWTSKRHRNLCDQPLVLGRLIDRIADRHRRGGCASFAERSFEGRFVEIIENVSLVDFYRHQTDRLKSRGFVGLIMVLAREADAPKLYSDILRYWNDLHLITGKRILFAVAGAPLPGTEDKALIVEGVHSDAIQIAATSGGSHRVRRDARLRMEYQDRSSLLAHFRAQERYIQQTRWKLKYEQAPIGRDIDRATSSQVNELRQFLDVSEAQTPCLHLTIFLPKSNDAFIFPIDENSGLSLWVAVKRIMSRLSPSLDAFERDLQARKFGNLVTLDRSRAERWQKLHDVEQRAGQLREEIDMTARQIDRCIRRKREIKSLLNDPSLIAEDKRLLAKIVNECSNWPRSPGARANAFRTLNHLKTQKRLGRESIISVQSYIDASFKPLVVDPVGSERVKVEHELVALTEAGRVASAELNRIDQEIDFHEAAMLDNYWARLSGAMIEAASDLCEAFPQSMNLTWEYFISYPRPEREAAASIWNLLSERGETFFDQRCLKPGDMWAAELASALSRSKKIVVLVSKDTPTAHYQLSEIQRAIDLHRKTGVKIIVAHRDGAELPLGLEQFQSVQWTTSERTVRSFQ